jgi:hypothetical protein
MGSVDLSTPARTSHIRHNTAQNRIHPLIIRMKNDAQQPVIPVEFYTQSESTKLRRKPWHKFPAGNRR